MAPDIDLLLTEALRLSPAARRTYVESMCGSDTALLSEVERLLLEADDADPFLSPGGALVGAFGREFASALERDRLGEAGALFGPYRVVSELGRGGMGIVLLAERADGTYEQRVALKVLKRGVDSEEILGRFRQERQILASLNHPNIARLFDGGIAADGRPYFAMELVEGESIARYCAAHALDANARLDMFVTVARAVEHAHRALVVHRDLKPSNILVTKDGEVKLLDFGIAKLVDPANQIPEAPQTGLAIRIMTPEYASPEQVRGTPVTTASDVYQLGLLLFELLTNHPAHRLDDAGRARLRSSLPVDVENILDKALREDPAERYGSVEQLADDIVRYRRGLPVRARGDSIAYRASRFVRRHPLAVGATSVTILSVCAIVAFYTVRLAAERNRAEIEAAKAAEVSTFLTGLFKASDPPWARDADISARELLDQGARRIETELADQPLVQAQLMATTGGIFTQLGELDRAEPLLRRSLELRSAHEGRESLAAAESEALLAILHTARIREPEAEPLLRHALAVRERLLGNGHPLVAETLTHLAGLTMHLKNEEMEALLRRARSIQVRARGPDHPDVATADELMATLFWKMGRYREMEPLYQRALSIRERAQGPDHPAIGATMQGLGSVYLRLREFAKSEPALLRALAIRERALGPDHHDTAWTVNTLGALYDQWGRADRAEPLYVRYLRTMERRFGPDHNSTGIALGNLGAFYANRGRLDEAQAHHERALAILERFHGSEHPNVPWALANLAGVLNGRKRFREAEPLYRRALAIRERTTGPGSPGAAVCLAGLARTLSGLGRHAEADPLFQRALRIRESSLGPAHRDVTSLMRAYAASLRAMKRMAEASALDARVAAAEASQKKP